MAKYVLILLWLMLICVSTKSKRQLMILMIGGARWDYVERMDNDQLYGFRYFKEKGVRVEYVDVTYPSLSYPGWTTLSTGLYPENHGIIGNVMYDKEHDEDFALGNNNTQLPLWWQQAEPIWTTATKAGLKVATIDWSRSDVPVRGFLPLFATGYGGKKKNITGKLQEAFSHIKNGFDLVMVHDVNVGDMGHEYGPNSGQVNFSMMAVGRALETFHSQLVIGGFMENVDIIIVSDHGMTSICNVDKIMPNISSVIDIERDTTKVIYDILMVGIFVKPNSILHVYNQLKFLPDHTVRFRNQIPDRFHYKRSSRVPDILIYPKYKKPENCHKIGGVNGVAPPIPDMKALFLAFGKSFKGEGLVHKPINMVDMYQIYCHILGIKPEPHNGSWDNVKFMMASSQEDPRELQNYLKERKEFTIDWKNDFSKNSSKVKYSSFAITTDINYYCFVISILTSMWILFSSKLK